jgi:hypothetical protein
MRTIVLLSTLFALGGCSSSQSADATRMLASPLAGVDGGLVRIGSPCTPVRETDPSFAGTQSEEVAIESSPGNPSGAPVCLTYHFRGRIECPYGQSTPDDAGASTACTTSSGQPVSPSTPVSPQCTDRRPADDVVWSCRCADPEGRTDNACDCPMQTTCVQAITEIDDAGTFAALAGAYCIPLHAIYKEESACATSCDPVTSPCD